MTTGLWDRETFRRKSARHRRARLSRQTSVPRRHERRQPFAGGIARLGGQSFLLSAKHSSQRRRDPSNCPLREVRRVWIHRILDHDGAGENEGGIEAWLRLGEACGLSRDELLQDRLLQPGVRFAVDAYVNFARTQPWPIAIASSLTELFAPDLMAARLAAFENIIPGSIRAALITSVAAVTQARRDSDEALAITLDYCNTPELQREAVRALEFKCDVLWSVLDAIHHAYGSS